jgi:DinB family protein
MQEQLAAEVKSLESAQSRLRALGDKLSDSEWTRRPSPERWSAADCVEHLNLTAAAYVPRLRDALARAGETRGAPTKRYRRDALGWFMALMVGPMRHLGKKRIGRVKTTPRFVPEGGKSREELLSDFVRLQAELIAVVRRADGLPIDKVRIVSPFGERMQYDAYSAIVIIARHEHRHLQQAEEAAGQPESRPG